MRRRILRFISLCMGVLLMLPLGMVTSAGEGLPLESDFDWQNAKALGSFALRDPCVILAGDLYYMYGTGAAWPGYGCYVSRDLQSWAGPFTVWTPPAGHPASKDFWAPECHAYNGAYYLFATYFSSETQHRGVSIFRAESPLGPFEEISGGHITPSEWDAIDGTLYIDEGGQPWMVFVHEWTSMPDGKGDFSCVMLSDNLSKPVGEPVALFKSTALSGTPRNSVTDGCWLHRTESGALLMLWSGFSEKSGYCVAVARSQSGNITGPWKQNLVLLYKKGWAFEEDGGHGMLFRDKRGRLLLSLHSPNSKEGVLTVPVFLEVNEKGGALQLRDRSAAAFRAWLLAPLKKWISALAKVSI